MAEIDNYVSVAISVATPAVSAQAFGTTLIAGTTAGWPTGAAGDLIRFYSSLAGVALDFLATTKEYLAAQIAFAQSPQPAQIAIGKLPTPVASVQTLTFSAATVTGNVINGSVNGVALAPTTWATSDAATLAAVATLIAAQPGITSAVAASPVITVTGNVGSLLTLSGFVVTAGASQPTVAVATTTAAVTFSTGLTAIQAVNNSWYGLAITNHTDPVNLDVAAWAEANAVLFGAASASAAILTTATTDVASVFQAKSYTKSFMLYNSAPDANFPEVAWLVSQLIPAPGSQTWAYKTLAGVTADTIATLSDTQRTNALAKNCNVYDNRVVAITEPGITPSGQFIDTMVGVAWLKTNMATDIFNLLKTLPKVPYTDKGMAIVENTIRTRLALAVTQGVLDGSVGPVITIPTVASQAAGDRAARIVRNIQFSQKLAGAIQNLYVVGTVSV